MKVTGGCLCGAVRYEAEGEPAFSAICHCRDCQRASGSIGSPVLAMPAAGFSVTGPVKRYTCQGMTGGDTHRNFCPECGSTLFGGTPETGEGVTNLYVGSLDDPSGFAPSVTIFTRDRHAWSPAFDVAHEFETMPPRRPA